jgi:hypothetical protein
MSEKHCKLHEAGGCRHAFFNTFRPGGSRERRDRPRGFTQANRSRQNRSPPSIRGSAAAARRFDAFAAEAGELFRAPAPKARENSNSTIRSNGWFSAILRNLVVFRSIVGSRRVGDDDPSPTRPMQNMQTVSTLPSVRRP